MKLLRALLGKTALTLLAILIQIGIYFAMAQFLELLIGLIPGTIGNTRVSQIIVGIVNGLVALIVIVRLTIRDMTPDAKVAWVTLLVFAPIAGALMYLLFAHNLMSRKKALLYMDIHARGKKYMTSEDDCADALGEYVGHSRYLYNAALAVPHRYSDVEFFPTGEIFYESLLAELEKAEKYILMEYFII